MRVINNSICNKDHFSILMIYFYFLGDEKKECEEK